MNVRARDLTWLLLSSLLFLPLEARAQDAAKFKPEELDQIVAPIALHPDALVAQVLMASTYPLEVVQAARFAKDNAKLQGDQLNEALKQHPWDDSVKSLVFFPQVLTMMSDKLDWLQKLGDAFLGQQKELMASIQRLRARAQSAGQLKSTPEQNVIVEKAETAPPPPAAGATPAPPVTVQPLPAQTTVQVIEAPPTVIRIEPTNPQVISVPAYDPTVVYGAWPPAYPPYYPSPPGYFAAGAFTFFAGAAVGAALWGDADWGNGDVNINNNNSNNFTNSVNNRQEARNRVEHRSQSGAAGGRQDRGQWKHSPEHRKGVQYRDSATQQRFDKTGPANAQSREAFRGRTGQGSDFSRASNGQQGGLGQGGARDRQGGGPGDRGAQASPRTDGIGQGGAGQGGGGFGDRGAQASPRTGGIGQGGAGQGGFSQSPKAGAFEGMGSGRDAQSFSSRGNASRESFSRSSTGGGSRAAGSGGARSGGGGGGRSGGGGRGGGGGGRR